MGIRVQDMLRCLPFRLNLFLRLSCFKLLTLLRWLDTSTILSTQLRDLTRNIHGLLDQGENIIPVILLAIEQETTHGRDQFLINPHVSLSPSVNNICPDISGACNAFPDTSSFLHWGKRSSSSYNGFLTKGIEHDCKA